MSIVVKDLTKTYGQQAALDGISFESAKGRITGFLGPNGAGKSTTMKIATGYIAPTSGTVMVSGFDVRTEARKVKKVTGYLPEHNPLYLEMFVQEYLTFVAEAYRRKDVKRRVSHMLELVGLHTEQHKKIGALSKGYRQRVGLAQALIHDPEVLILDEPTSGLDPNQLVEIRNVIKMASEQKTVILSTHIMQEVEAICDEVVIINKGVIVANDKVEKLKSLKTDIPSYVVEFEQKVDLAAFGNLQVTWMKDASYRISSKKEDPRKQIMKQVAAHDLPLVNITKEEQSLERVFQELTKDQ